MINRIIGSTFFVLALFALSLSLIGVEGPIRLAPSFIGFIKTCSIDLENFKIAIPDIPKIPDIPPNYDVDKTWLVVLNVLIELVNRLSSFINFITQFINIINALLNIILEIIQFFAIIIANLVDFRDSVVEYGTPLY